MTPPMELHMTQFAESIGGVAQLAYRQLDDASTLTSLHLPFSDDVVLQEDCSGSRHFLLPLDSCNAEDSLLVTAHSTYDNQSADASAKQRRYAKSSDGGHIHIPTTTISPLNTLSGRKRTDEELTLFNKTDTILRQTPSPIWFFGSSTADTFESQFSCHHQPLTPAILDDTVHYSTSPCFSILPLPDTCPPFSVGGRSVGVTTIWGAPSGASDQDPTPTLLNYPTTCHPNARLATGVGFENIAGDCENVVPKEATEDYGQSETKPFQSPKLCSQQVGLTKTKNQIETIHSFQKRHKHQPLPHDNYDYEPSNNVVSSSLCASSEQNCNARNEPASPPKRFRKDVSQIAFSATAQSCNSFATIADGASSHSQITPTFQKMQVDPRNLNTGCAVLNSNAIQPREAPHLFFPSGAPYYVLESSAVVSNTSSKQSATYGNALSVPFDTCSLSSGEETYFSALYNVGLSTPSSAACGFPSAGDNLSTKSVSITENGPSSTLTYNCNRSSVGNDTLSAAANPVVRRYPEAPEQAPILSFGVDANQKSVSSITTNTSGHTVAEANQESSWPENRQKPELENKTLWRRPLPGSVYTSKHEHYRALAINDFQEDSCKTEQNSHASSPRGQFLQSEGAPILSHHSSVLCLNTPFPCSASLSSPASSKRENKTRIQNRGKDSPAVTTVMDYTAVTTQTDLQHCSYPGGNGELPVLCVSSKQLSSPSSAPRAVPKARLETCSLRRNASGQSTNNAVIKHTSTTALISKESDSVHAQRTVQRMKLSAGLSFPENGTTDGLAYVKVPFYTTGESEVIQTPFPVQSNAYRCPQPEMKRAGFSESQGRKVFSRCFETTKAFTEELSCSALEVGFTGSLLTSHPNGQDSHGLVEQPTMMEPNLTRGFMTWSPVQQHMTMMQLGGGSSHFTATPMSPSPPTTPSALESFQRSSFYEETSALINKHLVTGPTGLAQPSVVATVESGAQEISVSGTKSGPRNAKQCSTTVFPRYETHGQTTKDCCAENFFFPHVLRSLPSSNRITTTPYTVQPKPANSSAQAYIAPHRPADPLSSHERLPLLMALPSNKKKCYKDVASSYMMQPPPASRHTNLPSVVPGVYFDRRKKGFRIRFQNIYVGWVSLSRYASYEDAYMAAKRIWDDAVCEAARHQNKQAAVNAGIPLQIQSRLKVKNPGGRPRTVSRLSPLIDARISAAVDTARFVGHDFLLANAVASASVLSLGHQKQTTTSQNNQPDYLEVGRSLARQADNF